MTIIDCIPVSKELRIRMEDAIIKPEGDIGIIPKATIFPPIKCTPEITDEMDYEDIKDLISIKDCIQEFFSNSSYQDEVLSSIKPLSEHSLKIYQYRLTTIKTYIKDKLANIKPSNE